MSWIYASKWLRQLWRTKRSDFQSVVYMFQLVFSSSTSTLYLEPSSGSLEASSPVNSCSQKLFWTILSDSQVHPHSGPLIYTWCHSSILGATHLYLVPLIYTWCHSSILGATQSTTYLGILSALYHTYNTPKKPLVLTTALVLQRPIP